MKTIFYNRTLVWVDVALLISVQVSVTEGGIRPAGWLLSAPDCPLWLSFASLDLKKVRTRIPSVLTYSSRQKEQVSLMENILCHLKPSRHDKGSCLLSSTSAWNRPSSSSHLKCSQRRDTATILTLELRRVTSDVSTDVYLSAGWPAGLQPRLLWFRWGWSKGRTASTRYLPGEAWEEQENVGLENNQTE